MKPYVLQQLESAAYYVDKQLQDVDGNDINISQIFVGENEPDPKEYELWIDPNGNEIPAKYISFTPTQGPFLSTAKNTQDAIEVLENQLSDIKVTNPNALYNWDFRHPVDNNDANYALTNTVYGAFDGNGVFGQAGRLKEPQALISYNDNYYMFYNPTRRKMYYVAAADTKQGYCLSNALRINTICRWYLFNNNANAIYLTKDSGYITLRSEGEPDNVHNEAGFGQSIPNPQKILNETITFSILTSTGETHSCTSKIGNSKGVDTWYNSTKTPFGFIGFYGNDGIFLECNIMVKNSTISIVSAKLEFGDKSTLIPEDAAIYNEEVKKCQSIYDADNAILASGYGVNKNLLLNWDFVFPHNYQRSTSYSIINGEILCIDCWRMVNHNPDMFVLRLVEDGLRVNSLTEGYLYQNVNPMYFKNKTLTFSIIDESGTVHLISSKIYGNIEAEGIYAQKFTYFGDIRIVGKDGVSLRVEIRFRDCDAIIRAAKLEISSISTIGYDQRISPIDSDLMKMMYNADGEFRSEIRNIKFSTEPPLAEDGNDGDIWFVYKE